MAAGAGIGRLPKIGDRKHCSGFAKAFSLKMRYESFFDSLVNCWLIIPIAMLLSAGWDTPLVFSGAAVLVSALLAGRGVSWERSLRKYRKRDVMSAPSLFVAGSVLGVAAVLAALLIPCCRRFLSPIPLIGFSLLCIASYAGGRDAWRMTHDKVLLGKLRRIERFWLYGLLPFAVYISWVALFGDSASYRLQMWVTISAFQGSHLFLIAWLGILGTGSWLMISMARRCTDLKHWIREITGQQLENRSLVSRGRLLPDKIVGKRYSIQPREQTSGKAEDTLPVRWRDGSSGRKLKS